MGFVVQFQADNFTSSVVSVPNGETLEVLHDGKAGRIRLNGIDCQKKGRRLATTSTSAPLET